MLLALRSALARIHIVTIHSSPCYGSFTTVDATQSTVVAIQSTADATQSTDVAIHNSSDATQSTADVTHSTADDTHSTADDTHSAADDTHTTANDTQSTVATSITLRTTFSISAHCDTKDCPNSALLQRPKRQLITDARTHLDNQIGYILAALPFQIDLAEETIEKKIKFLVLNKITWGWAVVIGALLDFYSDFGKMNRTEGNFGDISAWFGYGQVGFYGLGFGFPYLLNLPQDNLPCHSSDFLATLSEYKLNNGLSELFSTSLPISSIRAIVGEFDLWMRVKTACITNFASDHIEVAEVVFLQDELLAALNLRMDVEETERNKMTAPDQEPSANSTTDNSNLNQVDAQRDTLVVNLP